MTDSAIADQLKALADNGTQASPFNSIAAFNTAQGTTNGPDAGDFIYVRFGTGTYSEANGINLANADADRPGPEPGGERRHHRDRFGWPNPDHQLDLQRNVKVLRRARFSALSFPAIP